MTHKRQGGRGALFKKASNSGGYNDPDILVGLDLGTTKIAVVVAERDAKSVEAQIIGIGYAPSNGIRKGLIVNLDQAVRSVKQALQDAENMVGLELRDVTVSFSGGEINSVRSKGMISLGRAPRQVMQLDVERVIEAAQADVSIPANQSILHTIPVNYSLDGNQGIDDPLGMTGMRLDIDLQSVIVPTANVQNVLNCVEKAGLNVTGLVIKPLAAALGSLSPEEAMAGAASVDVGGGTAGVAVFSDGRPRHLAVIPVGGDHITNDVACVLKVPLNKAEELKKQVSLCDDDDETTEDSLEFEYMGRGYVCSKRDLVEIIQCRVEELFSSLVKTEIDHAQASMLPAGLVLTGGLSRSAGIDAYLNRILGMAVRVSLPIDSNRMPPQRGTQEYSAASGIIRYMVEKERDPFRYIESPLSVLKGKSGPVAASERTPRVPPSGRPSPDDKPPNKEGFMESLVRTFKELF